MHLCEVEGSQQPSGESLHESIQESRTRTTKETRAVQGWELARSTKLCHGCYFNVCPCLSMPEKNLKGCGDLLGRPGEWLSDTVLEHYWLVLVRHTLMHHWAVSIALNMGFESLMGSTPAYFANLSSRQCPIRKAMENLPQFINSLAVHQVHESIAQICIAVEITGQVCKVIFAHQPMVIQHLQEHLPRVVVGQIAQHHSGPFFAFANLSFLSLPLQGWTSDTG